MLLYATPANVLLILLATVIIVLTSLLYGILLRRLVEVFSSGQVVSGGANDKAFVGSQRFYNVALVLGIISIALQVTLMDMCERMSKGVTDKVVIIASTLQIILIPVVYSFLYIFLFRQLFCVLANKPYASDVVKGFVAKDMTRLFLKCVLVPICVYLLIDVLYMPR